MLEKLERKTAHVKVLVNNVWRELHVLSVVTVKDVKKGLQKHFGIPRCAFASQPCYGWFLTIKCR